MKRSLLICTIALLGCMLTLNVAAQTVKIKREAITPTRISQAKLKYTGITNPVSTGLRNVGKGSKVYLSADTTGTVTSFNWTFVSKPAGSNAVIDSATKKFVTFTPDVVGRYVVKVTSGSSSSVDSIWASTYIGTSNQFVSGQPVPCGSCHHENYNNWTNTAHAKIFKDGITGNLEVEGGKGAYAGGCIKCHTTGWDPTVDNNNFGFLAKKTGYDTTWYKGLELRAGDYWTVSGDQTAWNLLNSTNSAAVPMATIGCESCHGPGADHNGEKSKIGVSMDAGVCNQCHDSMSHHRLGNDFNSSVHATWPDGEHTSNTSCFPCHSGSAFMKWINNNRSTVGTDGKTSIFSVAADGDVPLTCAACHDPHGNGNPNQLRTVTTSPLKNGFVINQGGKGQLCMNCHESRYAVSTKVTTKAPYYGFGDHYGPHGNPQADMLFGQNAYEFGKSFAGYSTHTNLDNSCVTCHMQARTDVGLTIANHSWSMTAVDSKGAEYDMVDACKNCHGSSITKFDDIKGLDYDGDGTVNGVKTEIANLLAKLKAVLPKDANGEVVSGMVDSLKVKGQPKTVQAIYDYFFVKNDASGGMHNAKYAAALLQNALNQITGVEFKNNQMPKNYGLSQNFPNPFNPTTQIEFSVPSAARVKLNVYNAVGQLVATLADGEYNTGNYKVNWNGRDMSGSIVASGVYLYRLEVAGNKGNDFSLTKKMVFAK